MTKSKAKKVSELLSTIDIEVLAEDIKEIEDIDGLEEYLQDNNLFDVEIIYHYRAMEYLKENDASLQLSLEIAHEYGYTTDQLNSELLASLLASQNTREAFGEIRDELEQLL